MTQAFVYKYKPSSLHKVFRFSRNVAAFLAIRNVADLAVFKH